MRRVSLVALGTLLAVGCSIGKNQSTGSAPVDLLIAGTLTANGGQTTPIFNSGGLLSDVQTGGGVFDDYARFALRVQEKNADYTPAKTVDQNDVVVESYTVHYYRTDGHAAQGVDVPYDISGAVSGVVILSSHPTTNVDIEIVRHVAKLEPPLRTLVNGGGEDLIKVIAQVTIYGHTVSGVRVSATTGVDIAFGDFADPKASATPTPSP